MRPGKQSFAKAGSRKAGETLSFRDRLMALRYLPGFLRLVWQTSPALALANILLRLGQSALPLAILYVGKLIINEVVLQAQSTHGNASTAYLWQLVALEAGLGILLGIFWTTISLVDNLLGELVANATSIRIMEHAGTLDMDQFEDAAFYDKLERARQQTAGRRTLLSQVFSQFQDVLTMTFLSAGLIAFNPWLLLLISAAVLPAFVSEYYFNSRNYELLRSQTSGRRAMDYFRHIGASDEHAREVKVFGLSSFLVERFRSISGRFYRDNKRLAVRRSVAATVSSVLGAGCYYAGYMFILRGVIRGELSIGDLTFLAGSFHQLRSRLQQVVNHLSGVSMGAVYLKDYFDFFALRSRIVVPAGPRAFPRPFRQGFTFEDVGFRYNNSDDFSVRHISFTLQAGERLALVGANGAGKTTLVKLLARMYDPTEGRILLDGHDLRDYDPAELRSEIGIIFQDYLRYQMTSAENIAVGHIREKDNADRIIAAAQRSLADTIIDKMPGGYQQVLGRHFDQGIELSGGEWQKIALARAYMREAQLLILDEPTAALDAKAEYEAFQRFAELTNGKTAMLISHRFSTVRMADRILVLDKGALIETGSHEALLALGGHYAELFRLQAAGYR